MGMYATDVDPMVEVPEITFGVLYREHYPLVLAYFMRRFDPDTAVDCAAEVFTVLWRRIGSLPEGRQSVQWLYGVANNVARNQRRSLRRGGRLTARLASQPSQDPPPPDVAVVAMSEHERVREALNRLRSRDAEILRLATWEELSHAEIAELLGCTRQAATKRIHRAAERLRAELEGAER